MKNKDIDNKRRKMSIITIIILTVVIVMVAIFALSNLLKKDSLTSVKRVEDLEISNTTITQNGGLSWVTADVKNKGQLKENVKLNLIFTDKEGKEIADFIAYIDKIDKDQVYTFKSGITKELNEAVNVRYEIVK